MLTVLVAVLLFLFSVASFLLTAASVIMALLGVGLLFISYPVGGGVYEFVQERTDMEIGLMCSAADPVPDLNCPVTSDFSRIVSDPTVDTAIEVMGGRQPAYEYMCAALRAGKNVVTANKQLMSERYGELVQLAGRIMSRCAAPRPSAAASAG